MAKILFSLSGDGRGHATRARAMVEALRGQGHEITLFTFGQAFEFLAPIYRGRGVRVRRIGGLRFSYDAEGRLNYRRTLSQSLRYLQRLRGLVSILRNVIERERPHLVLADFEPALPRAARAAGVPYVSLDHQHFLLTYDLRTLPWWLRVHALYMAGVVRAYYPLPSTLIVSSFFFPPLRPSRCRVHQVGVLLRPEVEQARTSMGRHLVAYFRRSMPRSVLEPLGGLDREIHVYGVGERPPEGNLRFFPVCPQAFVRDLAACDGLVSTAGNQLVGEALYLGKPVFGIPERGNYEQYINAHFLAWSGAGEWVETSGVTLSRLRAFVDRLPEYRGRIDRERMNGLPEVLGVLAPLLEGAKLIRSGSLRDPHESTAPV